MINTEDIYLIVGPKLMFKGYWDMEVDGQKKLIISEIKRYLRKKILEHDTLVSHEDIDLSNIRIEQLIEQMSTYGTDSDTLIKPIIRYIIMVSSNIQGNFINVEFEDNVIGDFPIIIFEDGVCKKIIIGKDIDYMLLFGVLLENFVNNIQESEFYNKEKRIKSLTKGEKS